MRVRPFFWALLALVCVGVLAFASLKTATQTLPLKASIEQVITAAPGVALVRLHLADMEDQPIEQASILSRASMPDMLMEPQITSVQALGEGSYLARFQLSMPGYWELGFQVSAPGFVPVSQAVFLQEA